MKNLFTFNVKKRVEAFPFGCRHNTAAWKITYRSMEKLRKGINIIAGYVGWCHVEKCPEVRSLFVDD